ncbi:diguanylate cyclase [Egicoccus sp. AB-alg2]|uniref:GGDEF domain-containing protein n=1 Tax=Egicoccus sp. AB-alg2 TaxID=3242693 RepID=UPI00359CE427
MDVVLRRQDEVKRRVYLAMLGLSLPLIPGVAVLRWQLEPAVRLAYPALFVVLVALGLGLATRRLAVARAESLVLVAVGGLWLARLGAALYGSGDRVESLTRARDVVTESIGPGLTVLVLLLYLASPVRVGMRRSVLLVGAFVLVCLPALIGALLADADAALPAATAVVRQWVYVTCTAALAYGLAHLKEQVAEQMARNRALEELAHTDPLTGAANRRRVQAVLGEELARCRRYERPLSVAMIDLDAFKERNDHHGHAAGDDALCIIVAGLGAELRDTDTVGRWGGDELLIVLPETTLTAAATIAERIRARLSALALAAGPERFVTGSIGVAAAEPADTADSLLLRADRSMYAAKAAGGDRVVTTDVDGQTLLTGV